MLPSESFFPFITSGTTNIGSGSSVTGVGNANSNSGSQASSLSAAPAGASAGTNRPLCHPENPVVFLDVSIGDHPIGRIKIELYKHLTPKTAENFRQFCTGEHKINGVSVGYKDSIFHRVIKGFMIQGGDFVRSDGSGCLSIYGEKFRDENFILKHDTGGLLSMANSGSNTNGCQFFITCEKCEWLDNKHVVFGKILDLESMNIVRKIESVSVSAGNNRPKIPVKITECGEL